MRFNALVLLLPLVLAAHNGEEYTQLARFTKSFNGRVPVGLSSRQVVGGAMLLVSIAAVALSIAASVSSRGTLLTAVKISIFALGWNAVGHAIRSLLRRTVLPGTATAVAIVLPYLAAAVAAMHRQLGDSAMQLAALASAGLVALPLMTLVAASLSYVLSRALVLIRSTREPYS